MDILTGLHAGLGEMGAFAFFWVFIELLNASESSLRRARIVALFGVLLFIGSWLAGGYNYLTHYADVVKPLIKAGPLPWAHAVVTETKEHIFLFIPILAILVYFILNKYRSLILSDSNLRKTALYISFLVVLLALAMVGMGVLISGGFRAALETTLI